MLRFDFKISYQSKFGVIVHILTRKNRQQKNSLNMTRITYIIYIDAWVYKTPFAYLNLSLLSLLC